MAKSPAEILQDLQFFRLPPEERLKVMRTVDPNFAALPQEDQNKVLTQSLQRLFQQDPEKTAQVFMTPAQRQAYQKTGQIIEQREQRTAEQQAAEDKGDPGFLGTLGTVGLGTLKGLGQRYYEIHHPIEAFQLQHPAEAYQRISGQVKEAVLPRWEEAKQAWRSAVEGRPFEAGGHALATITPGGPTASQEVAEQFAKGHLGTGTAETIGLVGPSLFGLGREAYGRLFGDVPRPSRAPVPAIVQRGLSETEAEAGPLSLGMRTQDPYLLEVERQLAGGAGGTKAQKIAGDFYYGYRQRLAEGFAHNANRLGPAVASSNESVRQLFGRLETIVDTGYQSSNRQYDALRDEAAQHKVQVQTGTREVPGPRPEATLTPAGMPRTAPVMTTFEMPIALEPFRDAVNGVYQNILETLPEGQRAYSRGFQVLKEVATSDQQYMSAMAFDKFLSAMKGFLRDGNSELLTKSQGLAKRMITAGEKQLDETFEKFSPDMKKRLQAARDTVREYHRVDELKSSLPAEPGQAFAQLTGQKDRYADRLRELQKLAPQQVQTIGRMWLEGWGEKTTEVGGFTRAEGIFRALRDLGPETRELLFGKDLSQKLMDMSLGAKITLTAEGSATGRRNAAWARFIGRSAGTGVGGFLGALTGVLAVSGHVEAGIGVAAATGALKFAEKKWLSPYLRERRAAIWAEMLFQPGTPRLVRQVLNATVDSPAFRLGIEALNNRAILAEKRVRENEARPAPGAAPAAGVPPSPRVAPPQPPAVGGGRGAPRAALEGTTLPAAELVPKMAQAIKDYEGWKPGSASQRNNNPGNLKVLPNQTLPGMIGRDEQGFAIFRDYDAGWNALLNRVQSGISQGVDLNQFFAHYAPAGDRNRPLDYAKTVGSWLGIDPRTPLSRIDKPSPYGR